MTYESRRVYELGDSVHEQLAREERTDHARALARGRQLLLIADDVVARLDGLALITDPATVRREVFHCLASELYPGATSIDIPDFRSERALHFMRQGKSG
jgi:hypothetical protein